MLGRAAGHQTYGDAKTHRRQSHQPRREAGERVDQQQDFNALPFARQTVFKRTAVAMRLHVSERQFDLHALGVDRADLTCVERAQ